MSGQKLAGAVALHLGVILVFLASSGRCQDFCADFVTDDAVVIDGGTLSIIETRGLSLQNLVDCVEEGGRVVFDVERLRVNETLEIGTDINFQSVSSEGSSLTCGGNPIFDIRAPNVGLADITIRDCELESQAAPVVIRSGSNVSLTAVRFIENDNRIGSAAVRLDPEAIVEIRNSYFGRNRGRAASALRAGRGSMMTVSNSAFEDNSGGGTIVAVRISDLTVTGSTFLNNTATRFGGGALRINSMEIDGSVLIDGRSTFHDNSARNADGGAVLILGNASLSVTGSTRFSGNSAGRRGGAISVTGASPVSIENVFFTENESNFTGGGAIYAENATDSSLEISISNTMFSRNAARNYLGSGGGVRLRGSEVTCMMTNVSFVANTAQLDAAGIHMSHVAELNITGASFVGNDALTGGASAILAVSLERLGAEPMKMHIERSRFLFNRAFRSSRGGGAVGVVGFRSEVTAVDSEFHHNEILRGSGGAFYLFGGPSVEITNCMFTGNKAIWGGALYAESQASYELDSCDFERNSATEGGALHVRGDVDVTIDSCTFRNNTASREGGAIKLQNFLMSGDEQLGCVMGSSLLFDNQAGTNLFEDGIFGRETAGGGMIARGSGVDLEVVGNIFERNQASLGGAVSVEAVADSNFANNMFARANNNQVDEQVRPSRFPFYFENRGQFINNEADFGGGMYIASKTAVDGSSFNALVFMVRFLGTNFTQNKARSGGGGLALSGAAVQLQENCLFTSNVAQPQRGAMAGALGGAVLVDDGAVLDCNNAEFTSNSANIGGAAAVRDASMNAALVEFRENRAFPGGVGGAVAVEVTTMKDIPRLASQNRIRGILFECGSCTFIGNNGSLRGGALHLHHVNPTSEFRLPEECASGTNDATLMADVLTCETRSRYLERLGNRTVGFSSTTFEDNTAEAGGALFANDPGMIIASEDLRVAQGVNLATLLRENNETYLALTGVTFSNNIISQNGYGNNYATAPVVAKLRTIPLEMAGSQNLTVDNIVSGERLNITVHLEDALEQNISIPLNLTAVIAYDRENSEGKELEIGGQETAGMNRNGFFEFTGTRLRGIANRPYLLRIDFRSNSEALTIGVPSSFIIVELQTCRIGERTVMDGNVTDCQECDVGTVAFEPESSSCFSCAGIGDARCSGKAITPEDNFWHATSFSRRVFRCLTRDACSFHDRVRVVREVEEQAHLQGIRLNYVKAADLNDRQCGKVYSCSAVSVMHRRTCVVKGYEGLLCGACADGYGKENNRCLTCYSGGVRGFLLFLFVFWSFSFLTYFIRSVLNLANRVEFNRSFVRVQKEFQMRFVERLPPPDPVEETPAEPHVDLTTGETLFEITPVPEEAPLAQNSGQPPEDLVDVAALPTRKDLATVAASSLYLAKQARGAQQTENNEENEAAGVGRTKGKLAQKLQAIMNNQNVEQIVPLTLSNPIAEILKILVNFLQVTAVAVSITLDWTRAMRNLLVALGVISNVSSGSGFISLDCFMTSDAGPKSLRRMVIGILYPLMILAAYTSFWALRSLQHADRKRYFTKRVWLTYLAINYFVYINMTKSLFRFFACTDISDETLDKDYLVWEEDTAVICFSRRHAVIVGILVIPLLFAVTLGFPFGTLYILNRNRNRLNDEDFVGTYGFLYRAYGEHYWEVVIMVRKGLIALIAVFSHPLGENIQALLCILVMVTALSLHLYYQPFTQEIPYLNHLESLSLLTTVFVFVAGLMMNDSKTSEGSRNLLTALAALAVCAVIAVIIFVLITGSEEVIDMKLIETKAMTIDAIVEARLSQKLEGLATHYLGLAWEGLTMFRNRMREILAHRRPAQTKSNVERITSGRTATV